MDVVERFLHATGTYLGVGDDEEEPAELVVESAADGAGVSLHLQTGDTDPTFHEEHMIVGRARGGTMYLWGLDSTSERIRKIPLQRADRAAGRDVVSFGFGEPDDEASFCERMTFELAGDRISLSHGSARPGTEFSEQFDIEFVSEGVFQLQRGSAATELVYEEYREPPAESVFDELEEVYHEIASRGLPESLTDPGSWEKPNFPLLVTARADERLVGFEYGRILRPGRFTVPVGAVLPEFRSRGVESELVERLHEWAASKEARLTEASVPNTRNERLIGRLERGYEVVDVRHRQDEQLRVVLRREISSPSS